MKGSKVSTRGRDFKGPETDIHVRKERFDGENVIVVDVFDNRIKDAEKAHITSESFPFTKNGARGATKFIQDEGIRARLVL